MSALLLLILAAFPVPTQAAWKLERPIGGHITGDFTDRRIAESSGVAVSRRHPGVLWTQNDSGNPPWVFATDTSGAALGTFEVRGAWNRDWEDIALGPCSSRTCLYIADTGDNREIWSFATVYRIPEPSLPDRSTRRTIPTGPAEALTFRYPDGPHDVEAMWVARNGDVHLVSKGRTGKARHYRLLASAWTSRALAQAQLIESLPLSIKTRGDLVTGAALSPDGRIVAVRTYTTIYFFAFAADGRLHVPSDPIACDVRGLGAQGEGVDWLDSRRLTLTSEQSVLPAGTIAVAECPLPGPGVGK